MEATIGSDYMPKRLSRPSEYAYEDGCRPLGKFAGVLSVTLLVYAIVSVLLALALLMGAYLLSLFRGSRTFEQTTGFDKSWRGQPMDVRTPSSWRNRIRRWFGKKE